MTNIQAEPISIGHLLKTGTQGLHREVESTLSKVLFHRDLSAQVYLQVLLAMRAAYISMERALLSFPESKAAYKNRSKQAFINSDIAYMEQVLLKLEHGIPTRASNKDNLTQHVKSNVELHSTAQAMGMMYVLEGATLGGEHIQARLTRHDWLDTQHGVAFFNSYQEQRMARWGEFLTVLQQYYERNPDVCDEIMQGAELAFECIHDCLEGISL
jgi:heme oxygenase